MLRITVVSQTAEEAVLKVEGWISREDVALLEQEGRLRLQQSTRLVLDIENVRFISWAGIELLQRWSGKRLVLRNGSPFVRTLLQLHGLDEH